jgi:hypothetical protein
MSFPNRSWRVLAAIASVGALASAAVVVGVVRAGVAAPPTNTAPPTVLGTFQVGQTLSTLSGAWAGDPLGYSYQWRTCTDQMLSSCSDIGGATNPTYELQAGDETQLIRVQIVAINANGPSAPAVSAPVGPIVDSDEPVPVNVVVPTIGGPSPPVVGQVLTVFSFWTGASSLQQQWLSCDLSGNNCAPIPGATGDQYAPVQADVGKTIRVLVTAGSTGPPPAAARVVSTQSQPVGAALPVNTAKPAITGSAAEGEVLTSTNGTWQSATAITHTRQWQRCSNSGQNCVNIPGATLQTYTVQQADVGSTIVVVVTATNAAGKTSASSSPTAVVTGFPAGSTIPVSKVSLPNRLVVSEFVYEPAVLRSRVPFTARFRVSDTMGRFVSGAEVRITPVPYGRVLPPGTTITDGSGWATFNLQPTDKFPLIRGYAITVFVRATKPGDDVVAGVTGFRLTLVTINPF